MGMLQAGDALVNSKHPVKVGAVVEAALLPVVELVGVATCWRPSQLLIGDHGHGVGEVEAIRQDAGEINRGEILTFVLSISSQTSRSNQLHSANVRECKAPVETPCRQGK